MSDPGGNRACVLSKIAASAHLSYYYVMRSRVVSAKGAPEGHFSDPQFLVLTSLAGSPKHGHAMLDDIEQMTGARLGPGTLYGAISRLEQQGWIEPLQVENRRKPYRLTDAGARAFTAKMKTLQRIVDRGSGRLAPA
jgi:DNA-binding PadR family transcriptional regulator